MNKYENIHAGRVPERQEAILAKRLPIEGVLQLIRGNIEPVSIHMVPPKLVHMDPLRVRVEQTIIDAQGRDIEGVEKSLKGIPNVRVHDRKVYGKTHFEIRTWEQTKSGYRALQVNVYPDMDEAIQAGIATGRWAQSTER